jgi:hypothetical protein
MHEPGIYHLDEQYAAALLRPILARLGELEGRLQHYSAHLRMPPEDRAAIEAAGRVLAEACRELERIWQGRVEAGAWKRTAG